MKPCTYCGRENDDNAVACSLCQKEMETPMPVGDASEGQRYHTFRQRFFAGWIDAFVLLSLSLFDSFFLATERGPVVWVVWLVLSYSAIWLYSVILHAKYGQTLGKRIMRVRVVNVLAEERLPTFQQAFVRDVGYIFLNSASLVYLIYLLLVRGQPLGMAMPALNLVSCAGAIWFLLEVTTMLTNEKRRALHDLMAGTVVVRS